MIPLGSDSEPRLVIGHNVAYDRQETIFLPKIYISFVRGPKIVKMHLKLQLIDKASLL